MSTQQLAYVDVDRGVILEGYQPRLETLFQRTFGRPLGYDLWSWAYRADPFGDALVTLAMAGDRVVGHYAVIPMTLSCPGAELDGYLSMTTMVDPDFQGLGLFTELATRVYQRIEERGRPAVVFGFPNDSSTPGFVKRLGWVVDDLYRVVSVPAAALDEVDRLLEATAGGYTLSLDAADVRDWRCSKPDQSWEVRAGLGIKLYDGGNDVMYVERGARVADSGVSGECNVILPMSAGAVEARGWRTSFSYRFGYRAFNGAGEVPFFVQMSMSDVF